ncbi:hypothetical protein GCK32_020775 [Trichostrongylus colubriformis]|uniref:Uncharacterized protein n=1 Tax=Trichostrongylus colubriformis TaxID=6319 RepID=A0AAN8II52_TRICO
MNFMRAARVNGGYQANIRLFGERLALASTEHLLSSSMVVSRQSRDELYEVQSQANRNAQGKRIHETKHWNLKKNFTTTNT